MTSNLTEGTDQGIDALASFGELSEAERLHRLLSLIREQTSAILGRLDPALADPALVDPDKGFADLGFDSLMAIELRDRVQTLTGVKLAATVTFDHPTSRHLAAFVRDALAPSERLARQVQAEPNKQVAPAADEAIAIVGLALRVPGGATGLDEFWRFLEEGRSAVGPIPASRWNAEALYDPNPDAKNSSYVRDAAMLDDIDRFDAAFFGISPREAKHIDPQHRLLLEAAWEAIEGTGIVPSSLKDSSTGVFVGIGPSEYASLKNGSEDAEAHAVMGTSPSFAAGRLAFSLGLQGPTLSVDTACSSSLVALHLACQALRQRECNLALAAGVQVMASPEAFTLLSRTRALARDGRSKTFSAHADGYGRGEGVVVLALERLSDARARQHQILALVRGSAINHDGASSGITAPNGTSQQKVLRAALRDAGVGPLEVDVVECHGTGTSLGDPIEVQALAAVYGEERPRERPLLIGAVKTNIGHLESAAGLAGVAKIVASLRHDALPPTLNTTPPNPHIEWDALAVDVVGVGRAWPPHPDGTRRRAGVSAFGLSGTNAHVILEESPDARRPTTSEVVSGNKESGPLPVLLAAKTQAALRDQALRLREHLAVRPELSLGDVAYSLALTRSQFEHRAVIVAEDRAELLAALEAMARGLPTPNVVIARSTREAPVAFVFPGQGSEWQGMARSLLESSAPFREQVEACERAFAAHVDWSLRSVLRGEAGAACLDRVDVAQPVLFAVQLGLAALWRSRGVEPAAVIGHGEGEIVAACVAGALELNDAAKIALLRSRALTHLARKGEMAATELEIDAVSARLVAELGDIVARPAVLAFYSTVTACKLVGSELDAQYWGRNLRQSVRFEDAVKRLLEDGHRFFVELSPHPTLSQSLRDSLEAAGTEPNVVGTLLRGEGSETRFLLSLGELHARGFAVDWTRALPRGRGVPLPTYPFQRERFWLEAPLAKRADMSAAGLATADHPLLGAAVTLADSDGLLFTSRLSLSDHPWLASHVVFGTVILPGATFVELALIAAHRVDLDRIDDLTLEAPLVLPAEGAVLMQLGVGAPDEAERRSITFHARAEGSSEPWQRVASGVLAPAKLEASFEMRSWPPSGAVSIPIDGFYERLSRTGLVYGPEFQGLQACWRRGEELFAEVRLSPVFAASAGEFALHPALLDACLHPLMLESEGRGPGDIVLPFSWSGVSLRAVGASTLRVHLHRDASGALSLSLADATGERLASIESLTVRPSSAAQFRSSSKTQSDALLRLDWYELASEASDAPQIEEVAILGAIEPELAATLEANSIRLARHASVASLCDALAGGAPPPQLVVVPVRSEPLTEDGEAIASATAALACDALELLQAWFANDQLAASRLVFLTSRAVATRSEEDVSGLAQASLWGLVRSAQSENPAHSILLVDLDAAIASYRALPAALTVEEPQLALRAGRVFVPRLAPGGDLSDSTRTPRPLDPNGTVLITGGTGTLGGIIANHLVREHGIKHLVLASRHGDESPGAAELTRELTAAGAFVTLAKCDAADRPELERLFATIPSERPLTAVVHAAGMLDDGILTSLAPERLRRMLRSKVNSAVNLHALTESLDLSAFVLFSSLAGVLGNPGQASYAAANTFLDALAHHRQARALPAVALGWGVWAQKSAMTGHLGEADLRRMARGGIRPLSTAEGLALFDAALARPEPAFVAAHFDMAALRARAQSLPPMLRGLAPVRPARPLAANAADGPSLKQSISVLSPAERERTLVALVRTHVAGVLGIASPDALELNQSLQELGLDSLLAVEVRNRLSAASGLRLTATLLFNYPTVGALAQFLQSKLAEETDSDSKSSLSDHEIQTAIASVSVERLREAGLLDRLLALALSSAAPAAIDAKSAVHEIASMSVDDLVRRALEGAQNG